MSAIRNTSKNKYDLRTRDGRIRALNKLWQARYIYLICLPVVAYFIIFHYWSMGWLRMAFYDYKFKLGFEGSKYVGFKNFETLINGYSFKTVVINTLIINTYNIVFTFPFPIILAILLSELRGKHFKRLVQTISYMPHFLSAVVVVSLFNVMLSPSTGVVNGFLKAFGLETIYFMGDEKWFRPVYTFATIWQQTGWNAIVYIASISAIDQSLYEAARVDGAGRLRQIWHVTLPGIRGTISILLVLRIGNLFVNSFDKPYLMQNSLNLSVSELLSTYTYKIGMVNGKYSVSVAVGLLNSVVSLILVIIANLATRKLSETSLF